MKVAIMDSKGDTGNFFEIPDNLLQPGAGSDLEGKLVETAKLREDCAKLGEENASLKETVAELSSDDYALASLRDWVRKLSQDDFYRVGAELGYLEKPEATVEDVAKVEEGKLADKEPANPEVVYDDPHDDAYFKIKDLPIWIFRNESPSAVT